MTPSARAVQLATWSEWSSAVAYLFDTDVISEFWKPRPAPGYLRWAATVGRGEQVTSALVVAELYKGAFRSARSAKLLNAIENHVKPRFTILKFGVQAAREYARVRAQMEAVEVVVAELDLLIAATALHHDLAVVTGNVSHFGKVPGLRRERALAEARMARPPGA